MVAAKQNNYTLKRKRWPQRTEEEVDKLCSDLLDYARNARSIHLANFCHDRHFTNSWLSELAARNEKVGKALSQAKELLACKVLNASFYGEGNPTVGLKYLPVYDQEYKAHLKWESDLTKEEVREGSKAALLEYLERIHKAT